MIPTDNAYKNDQRSNWLVGLVEGKKGIVGPRDVGPRKRRRGIGGDVTRSLNRQ